MRYSWTSLVGLGACCLFSILLLSDISWARPKKPGTYWACKCACRWEDELGKEHFGPSGAVQFNESSLERCLGHKCTTNTATGTKQGTTRDCTATEHTKSANIPSGNLPTLQQQTPTTPGRVPAPAAGTIQRRGVEGDQGAETTPGLGGDKEAAQEQQSK